MKFHILSDLHVSHSQYTLQISETDADAIILAGDIGNGNQGLLFIEEIAQDIDKPIIIVLGNHDFYGKRYDKVIRVWEERLSKLDADIRFLHEDNVATYIGDVLVLGSTLWTDFHKGDPMAKVVAMECMNDFACIDKNTKGRKFLPTDAAVVHINTLNAFRKARDLHPLDKLVIVSHHAPSFRSVGPRYKGDLLNGAFASDLEDFMYEMRADLWVHGHMHNFSDYKIDNTRVVCNPVGYTNYNEHTGFQPDFVVEV